MGSSRTALAGALVFAMFAMLLPQRASAAERLKVAAAERDNLQYLAFWVAKGGGLFEREGIDIEIVEVGPKAPLPIETVLEKGDADGALLPPPVYLRAIAAKSPMVIVANLFANDPHALVVRADVAEARKIAADGPLRERLAALKGAKIGVPPPSWGRFKSLLATQGLDLDKDVAAEILLARDQATAFEKKKVEAMFVATPALEKAVAGASAVVVVNMARGEVPELATRQTNVFAVSRRVLTERSAVVVAMFRALGEAETRIHGSRDEAVDALARELPARDRRELEAAVALYAPAVPETPVARAEDLAPALELIPSSIPKPDLAGVDLASFVAQDLAPAPKRAPLPVTAIVIAVVAGVLLVLLVARARRRPEMPSS